MRQQPQEQPSVQPTYQENRGVEDAFRGVLDSISRTLFWGGIGGTILGIGLLLYAFITFSRGEAAPAQALANVDIFSKIEVAALIALLLATTWMWWGEETLGILQLGFGAALYFAPLFVPNIFGGVENEVTKRALEALRRAQRGIGKAPRLGDRRPQEIAGTPQPRLAPVRQSAVKLMSSLVDGERRILPEKLLEEAVAETGEVAAFGSARRRARTTGLGGWRRNAGGECGRQQQREDRATLHLVSPYTGTRAGRWQARPV